jgi:hypothetical protein
VFKLRARFRAANRFRSGSIGPVRLRVADDLLRERPSSVWLRTGNATEASSDILSWKADTSGDDVKVIQRAITNISFDMHRLGTYDMSVPWRSSAFRVRCRPLGPDPLHNLRTNRTHPNTERSPCAESTSQCIGQCTSFGCRRLGWKCPGYVAAGRAGLATLSRKQTKLFVLTTMVIER